MESQLKYQPERTHPRHKAMHRALVLVSQGPEALPYHIIDISEGGLAFRYLGQKLKGNITCSSEPQKGVVFKMSIPLET